MPAVALLDRLLFGPLIGDSEYSMLSSLMSPTISPCCLAADVKGAKADAGQAAQTYRAPVYNAVDVEKGTLTKQKQLLGEEPREFIRFQ